MKNAIFTQLVGVSCTSPKACTAVGSYNADASLVERWNGSVWKVQPTSYPRTSIYAGTFLNGVSCSSSTACVAVGESNTLRGFSHAYDTRSLAERWNGRIWSIESTPRPQLADEAFLDGVSCVATSACTTVGSDLLNPSGVETGLLAESWSGMKWSIQTAPEPANPNSTLAFSGISCTSAAHCMAVGSPGGGATLTFTYPGGDSAGVVAEQESGAGWVQLSPPTPPGVDYFGLAAVSCSSPTSCMAVGEADIGSASAEQLIEHWNGVSWTIEPTAAPTPPPAPVSSPAPVLGDSAAGASGYGHAHPVSLGQVTTPTTQLTGLRWDHWGASQATATGTGFWLPPTAQFQSQAQPAAADVVAFDLGTCKGTPAYLKLEWFFPSHGGRFIAGDADSICV